MQLRPPRNTDDEDAHRCRICGRDSPLSFEHVPPRSAFNRDPAEMSGMESWLERENGGPQRRGTIQQRGTGFYTLCEDCNNRAGRLYVPEFRKWARMGMDVLRGPDSPVAQGEHLAEETYVVIKAPRVQPARFLKQVVTMMLAISPGGFPRHHPDLLSYAQDPEWIGLPDRYQLYLTMFSGPYVRYIAGAATMRGIGTGPITSHLVFEIAYPPFAYVLSIDEDSPALEFGNMAPIADLTIHQTCDVEMTLVNGFGHTPLPLDYRTTAALEQDRAANQADDG